MDQIRLAWGSQGRAHAASWAPDTPQERIRLRALVDANNAVHGAGTHWLEYRRLVDQDSGGLSSRDEVVLV